MKSEMMNNRVEKMAILRMLWDQGVVVLTADYWFFVLLKQRRVMRGLIDHSFDDNLYVLMGAVPPSNYKAFRFEFP